MTDFKSRSAQRRDQQDATERGVFGEVTYVDGAGAHMTVRGTGTIDAEVSVLNTGYGFNLDTDSNAEVVMLSLGADVNDKVALLTIPKDMQHPWAVGQGGVQHPTDPNRRLEFNDNQTWLKDGNYTLGNAKEVSVSISDGAITINVTGTTTLTSSGAMKIRAPDVSIVSNTLTHNGVNIGDDHRHGGVDTGGGVSGGPQ
jgi:hypothetical protein